MKRLRLLLCLLLLLPAFAAHAQPFDTDYSEKINGTKLHFRVRGDDPKNPYLLILHGGPGFSAHMFYPWGKSIEKTVNVVYLDQRGSGQSERLTFQNAFMPTKEEVKDYTLPNLLRDIEGVRTFLKIEKWYVLGHSWGGMLGLEYITAYPDRVSGYLHVDGLLSQPKVQETILDFAEAQIAKDDKSTEKGKQERANRLKPFVPYARKLSAGPERYLSCMQFAFALFGEFYYADPMVGVKYNAKIGDAVKAYKLPPTVLAPANEPPLALLKTESYATRDVTPLLARVTCKTLVINGKQDGIITPLMAEIVQKGIKGANLLLLDNCGHFPFAEQPDAFTGAVVAFVQAR